MGLSVDAPHRPVGDCAHDVTDPDSKSSFTWDRALPPQRVNRASSAKENLLMAMCFAINKLQKTRVRIKSFVKLFCSLINFQEIVPAFGWYVHPVMV